MTNIHVLLTNGILRMGELADQPEEAFTAEYDFIYGRIPVLTTTPQGTERTSRLHKIASNGTWT
jgi:hypothetical protein